MYRLQIRPVANATDTLYRKNSLVYIIFHPSRIGSSLTSPCEDLIIVILIRKRINLLRRSILEYHCQRLTNYASHYVIHLHITFISDAIASDTGMFFYTQSSLRLKSNETVIASTRA